MKKIFLVVLIAFSLSSCEKDDICDAATSTTPRLVIEFYDSLIATPTLKNLTNMKAVATGGIPPYEGVVFNSATDSSRYLTNASKIYLPLDPSSSTTTYKLTYNFGAATENTDVLSFKYTRDKVYISRACGYKYLFNLTNNNTTDNILPPSINNWIKNIIIVKPNLETENEVHIKIYF